MNCLVSLLLNNPKLSTQFLKELNYFPRVNFFQLTKVQQPSITWKYSGLVVPNSGWTKNHLGRRPSRWWRSKTWRSPSSPQIHQKYIYMWNNSYRTPTEQWQKTSDFPKGKKFPTYLGRAKEKRKNWDKRIRTGPAPLEGSCEGGKVSTH